MQRPLVRFLVAATALVLTGTGSAQERAGIVTTLEGTALVTRAGLPAPAPLKFRDDVYVADRIATGERSVARILLGGKAVVTVRERSVLTITETTTSSTLDLATGKIALSVAKDRMKPGDTVQIRTPNAIAGIRGTVVLADVSPAGGTVRTIFSVLTGVVEVAALDAAHRPIGQRALLDPLHSVAISGLGGLGPVQPLTSADVGRLRDAYRAAPIAPPTPADPRLTEGHLKATLGSFEDRLDRRPDNRVEPRGPKTRGAGEGRDFRNGHDDLAPVVTKVPPDGLKGPRENRGRRGRGGGPERQ